MNETKTIEGVKLLAIQMRGGTPYLVIENNDPKYGHIEDYIKCPASFATQLLGRYKNEVDTDFSRYPGYLFTGGLNRFGG